jgi:hypothetical protein
MKSQRAVCRSGSTIKLGLPDHCGRSRVDDIGPRQGTRKVSGQLGRDNPSRPARVWRRRRQSTAGNLSAKIGGVLGTRILRQRRQKPACLLFSCCRRERNGPQPPTPVGRAAAGDAKTIAGRQVPFQWPALAVSGRSGENSIRRIDPPARDRPDSFRCTSGNWRSKMPGSGCRRAEWDHLQYVRTLPCAAPPQQWADAR